MARKKRGKKQTEDVKQLSDVLEKIKLSDDNLSNYTDSRFVRFYQLYRNYIPKNKWATRTKIFTPLVFGVIETQTARVMSSKPVGEWKPAAEGAVGDPEKIQMAFNEWWRTERAVMKSQDMFKKTLLYGSASAQMFWKHETGYKLGKPFTKTNRPSIRVLRLEDKMFGYDPEATSFDECKWAFIRYGITPEELKDMETSPQADLYKNVKEAIKSFIDDDGYEQKAMMSERLDTIDATPVRDTTVKKAECIYLENYQTGECITVVGQKHVIMARKNPYLIEKQLLMTHNTRIPGEIIGMSEVEPIETMQHGVNLFRGQRGDAIDDLLNPKWIVGDDADVDDNEITEGDSLIVHTADINQVKPMPKDNLTNVAFKEDEAIKNDIYAASSVTPFSMGNDNDVKSDRSGKAIAHLQSAADARIKSKMMNFEVDFIKEVAEKWQRLMAQYQTEDIIIENGNDTVTITPEDLGANAEGEYGEWDYYVETGSTQHVSEVESREDYIAYQDKLIELSQLKKQDMMPQEPQMDQMGQPMPQAPPTEIVDYDKMAEKLSEVFNIKDWREMWISEQEEQGMEQGGELLPGLEDAQPQGEMLPSMDTGQQGEMLPDVGEIQDMRQDSTLSTQEMLPSLDGDAIAPQEALPAVEEEKPSLFRRLKEFLSRRKGKKGEKEQLPPV